MFLPAGHKISKMGKGVSKRTRTFKNSFTTRMQINNKEQEIEKYFLELGHRFYEDHVDNPPLEYRDCMEAIYVLNQEICGAKEHLKLLQGIRLCPDCQGESPIDAAFCAYCGHPFPPLRGFPLLFLMSVFVPDAVKSWPITQFSVLNADSD